MLIVLLILILIYLIVSKIERSIRSEVERVTFCRLWGDVCKQFLDNISIHITEDEMLYDFDIIEDALNELDFYSKIDNTMKVYDEYSHGKEIRILIDEKFSKVKRYFRQKNYCCDIRIDDFYKKYLSLD